MILIFCYIYLFCKKRKENSKIKNKFGEIMIFEEFFKMKILCDLWMI